jgi:transcription elongation factor GreA-like protein
MDAAAKKWTQEYKKLFDQVAADMLFDLTAESGDRAYASVEALAEELVTNEKDTSGITEDIKEIDISAR